VDGMDFLQYNDRSTGLLDANVVRCWSTHDWAHPPIDPGQAHLVSWRIGQRQPLGVPPGLGANLEPQCIMRATLYFFFFNLLASLGARGLFHRQMNPFILWRSSVRQN